MKKNAKSKIWVWATAVTLAAAMGAGCKSNEARQTQVKESSDQAEHNRLLVHLALSENVYNGIAAERAVYARDFDPGSAMLNRLGTRRVDTIVDASHDSAGRVVVVRGDAPDALYAARVATVRKELADAGLNPEEVPVATDTHVGGGGASSDRALLTYNRMMSDYLPKQKGGPAAAAAQTPTQSNQSRNGAK